MGKWGGKQESGDDLLIAAGTVVCHSTYRDFKCKVLMEPLSIVILQKNDFPFHLHLEPCQ